MVVVTEVGCRAQSTYLVWECQAWSRTKVGMHVDLFKVGGVRSGEGKGRWRQKIEAEVGGVHGGEGGGRWGHRFEFLKGTEHNTVHFPFINPFSFCYMFSVKEYND